MAAGQRQQSGSKRSERHLKLDALVRHEEEMLADDAGVLVSSHVAIALMDVERHIFGGEREFERFPFPP